MRSTALPEWDNILAHVGFYFGVLPQYIGGNMMPDWSISLEMQFYLLFPFLIVVLRTFGVVLACSLMLVAVLLANSLFGVYLEDGPLGTYSQPAMIALKLNLFLAGMGLAAIGDLQAKRMPKKRLMYTAWAVVMMFSLSNAAPQVWLVTVMLATFLFTNSGQIFKKILSFSCFRIMGDLSYSVYLSHVMVYVPSLFWLNTNDWFRNLANAPKLAVALLLITPLVYAVSFLLYKAIELPGIRLGRYTLDHWARADALRP